MGTQIQLTIFLNWKKRKITQITVKALLITWKAVTLVKVESNSWPTENAKALPIPSNSKSIDEDLQCKFRESKSMEIVAGNSRRDNIYRWEQDFTGGVESTINKYVYNGMKLEC